LDLGWWILILREKDGEKKGMHRQITLSDDKKIIQSIWSFYGLVMPYITFWSKKCNVQQLDFVAGKNIILTSDVKAIVLQIR
jgi:hypothetical protein